MERYLDNANCWPELEQVDGFVDNIGYRSLTCEDGFSYCPAGATKKPRCGGRREAPQYYSPMERHRDT